MQQVLLFPTLVTHEEFEVSQKEKDLWFDAYIKHSREDGTTHDFLGFERVHHEESLKFFFTDKLMPTLRQYLKTLNIEMDNFDVHVTKTFFNVTEHNGILPHNHEENHISFTYYPNVAPGTERQLKFFHPEQAHGNEPYSKWFHEVVDDWDHVNARSFSLPVSEGTMYIFPSKLDHDIVKEENDRSYVKAFKTKDELKKSRFCVAGDMMLTRNKPGVYRRSLTRIEDWRKF